MQALGFDLATILGTARKRECHVYAPLLRAAADEREQLGQSQEARRLHLLEMATSFSLQAFDKREPLKSLFRGPGWRSAAPEDLSDADLDELASILDQLGDPELRARVADVLFVRRRHHRFGQVAVKAYIDASRVLYDRDHWPPFFWRVERAYRLAHVLPLSEREEVLDHVDGLIIGHAKDASYLPAKLLDLTLEYRHGDPAVRAKIAEDLARDLSARGDHEKAGEYWNQAARWHKRGKAESEFVRARMEVAAQHAQLAEATAAQSRAIAAHHLERAISVLRALPNTQAEVQRLHRMLLEYQEEALREIKGHSVSTNIQHLVEKSREHVRGVSTAEALVRFAMLTRPPEVSHLRRAVEETARQAVLLAAIRVERVNRRGKVVARAGSLLSGDDEEREQAFRARMLEHAAQLRQLTVVSGIEPARQQLLSEHAFTELEFAFVDDSPFVPPGRAALFKKGLLAGMQGDFVTAAHILVPQVEQALRLHLEARGAITSALDSDGIQNERDLGWLLHSPEAKEMFGDDYLFELQGLLVERFGANLRNLLAHGLLEPDECEGVDACYFWWLVLHLAVLPFRTTAPDATGGADQ